MHKATQTFLSTLLTLALSGCIFGNQPTQTRDSNAPSIVSMVSPGQKIPMNAVFAWNREAIRIYRNEKLADKHIPEMIEQEIDRAMISLGMRFTSKSSTADYLIFYIAGLESDLHDSEILKQYGLLPGNHPVINDPSSEIGSLIVYVIDRVHRSIVWHAVAQTQVYFSMNDRMQKKQIGYIIRNMVGSLPLEQYSRSYYLR
jgi:hypothetical protein